MEALLKEVVLQQNYLEGEPVETIYFGGGTPSLLPAADIQTLLQRFSDTFPVRPGAEITLEANPDDMTHEKAAAWKAAGINRLSIGIQSFREEDLSWMNRAHQAAQAKDCIQLARAEGFENLTIDLIYGGPTLPDEAWQANVEMALQWQIPHLSCYALTVEPDTALESLIRAHRKEPVDPGRQARQFTWLMHRMEAAGYEQYEISNFALPGKKSRHNSAYWEGKKYLGLGPSAHSYNGRSRQWNVANNALYIQALGQDRLPFESETLTPVQQLNEYIMTALRTSEGIDLSLVANRFSEERREKLLKNVQQYIHREELWRQDDHLRLTVSGKLFADRIASDLFFETEDRDRGDAYR